MLYSRTPLLTASVRSHRSSLKSLSKTGPPIPHYKCQYGIPTVLLKGGGVTDIVMGKKRNRQKYGGNDGRGTTLIPYKGMWVTMYGGRVKVIKTRGKGCGWGQRQKKCNEKQMRKSVGERSTVIKVRFKQSKCRVRRYIYTYMTRICKCCILAYVCVCG